MSNFNKKKLNFNFPRRAFSRKTQFKRKDQIFEQHNQKKHNHNKSVNGIAGSHRWTKQKIEIMKIYAVPQSKLEDERDPARCERETNCD